MASPSFCHGASRALRKKRSSPEHVRTEWPSIVIPNGGNRSMTRDGKRSIAVAGLAGVGFGWIALFATGVVSPLRGMDYLRRSLSSVSGPSVAHVVYGDRLPEEAVRALRDANGGPFKLILVGVVPPSARASSLANYYEMLRQFHEKAGLGVVVLQQSSNDTNALSVVAQRVLGIRDRRPATYAVDST